nr:A24 family peptidase [Phytoactinopolyspora mesophila]
MRTLPLILAVATATVWVLIGTSHAGLGAATIAYLLVGAFGTAMAYIDVREHRLPDWLTLPALGIAGLVLGVVAAVEGEWGPYGRAWAGAFAVLAFYLLLVLIRPSDLGLGDVKLAAVIGLLLGWISWPVLVFGVFAGFAVGAMISLALLITGRAGRRTSIPFGPAMLLGALIAVVWGEPIVDAYLGL